MYAIIHLHCASRIIFSYFKRRNVCKALKNSIIFIIKSQKNVVTFLLKRSDFDSIIDQGRRFGSRIRSVPKFDQFRGLQHGESVVNDVQYVLDYLQELDRYLQAVFRIRDILVRIRILGSEHLITNPDPAPFVRDFQDANKK